jgi:cytochrome P450
MLAGFDTTATTLTSICYQLAKNPDVQEKLYESIVAKMADYVSLLQTLKCLKFIYFGLFFH